MDWTAPIDLYCERLGPGLWAEPLNAVSDVAFLVAAWIGFAALRRQERSDPPVLALILIVVTIGVGSFLFHVFANGWSIIANILPITVFFYVYLGLALRRFFALPWPAVTGALAIFAALSFPIEAALRPLIAGSAAYAPPLAAMAFVGAALLVRGHRAGLPLLAASAVFFVSLVFRTLDAPLCPRWPLGTLFIWNVLNAATLTILLLAAVTSPSPRISAARSEPPTA